MADTPQVVEVDCSTGVSTTRDMTADEIAAQKAQADAFAAQQAAQAQAEAATAALKASAKAKLIAGQPLTAEEADTLVL